MRLDLLGAAVGLERPRSSSPIVGGRCCCQPSIRGAPDVDGIALEQRQLLFSIRHLTSSFSLHHRRQATPSLLSTSSLRLESTLVWRRPVRTTRPSSSSSPREAPSSTEERASTTRTTVPLSPEPSRVPSMCELLPSSTEFRLSCTLTTARRSFFRGSTVFSLPVSDTTNSTASPSSAVT